MAPNDFEWFHGVLVGKLGFRLQAFENLVKMIAAKNVVRIVENQMSLSESSRLLITCHEEIAPERAVPNWSPEEHSRLPSHSNAASKVLDRHKTLCQVARFSS